MLPSQIVQMSRDQTNTSTDIVTQINAYNYMNYVIADFWKDISDNSIGQSITSWTYNTTSGTNSYVLPAPVANTTLLTSTFGIQQLTKIGIKYLASQTNYTPVSLEYIEGMLALPEYYSTSNIKTSPIALTDGTNVLVYPTPTESVTNGIQFWGPKLHFPLGTTGSTVVTEDVAACILIPESYHYVIVEGLKYRFYGARGSDFTALATQCKANYEAEKMRTINQLLDRMQVSSEQFMPDLSYRG